MLTFRLCQIPPEFYEEINVLARDIGEELEDDGRASEATVSRHKDCVKRVQAHLRDAARFGGHSKPTSVLDATILVVESMHRMEGLFEQFVDIMRFFVSNAFRPWNGFRL